MLLFQIAEKRKLVSSIKDTTPNLDHGKPCANEDYGSSSSSVSANTDAIKKEENGNGSASSSSYGKSSLNKVPEANKTSPLLERSKQSSASSPATSPEKEKPSGVASRGKPWSSVVDPSSALTSSKKTSDNRNPSKSPAGAFWSDPLPSYLTKTPETSSVKTEEYMETKEEKNT